MKAGFIDSDHLPSLFSPVTVSKKPLIPLSTALKKIYFLTSSGIFSPTADSIPSIIGSKAAAPYSVIDPKTHLI